MNIDQFFNAGKLNLDTKRKNSDTEVNLSLSFYEDLKDLKDAWLNKNIPGYQHPLVEQSINESKNKISNKNFSTFIKAIEKLNISNLEESKLLEIGCSSGYYSQILKFAQLNIDYSGCDISKHFIDKAKQSYPEHPFDVEDSTCLTYEDNSFDVVVSGCCLQHILDYEKAISETARVSSKYVILHRTPLINSDENKYYIKNAYNVKMPEIHFSKKKLYSVLSDCRLKVLFSLRISSLFAIYSGVSFKTIVCEKI